MASFFLSQTNSELPEPARPKRPRSSLACIRCRKKKVKCDFVQPTCNRCSAAGLPCSYATPPRRVDGHAFDQLGCHVQELKERMRKMQAELTLMKHSSPLAPPPSVVTPRQVATPQVTWKLSVSPAGLRVDTNLASVAELYHILLNGISQLNTNTAFEPVKHTHKIDEIEPAVLLPKPHLDHLMHTCYHSCFIPYQVIDKETFTRLYIDDVLDPLLTSSINAWMGNHGCIFHNIPHGNAAALGETYFANAREALKRNFDVSSPTAIQALLHLYMYQLNSERPDLAYLYIGLAMRMAQDLNLHRKECMATDERQREAYRRLWWSTYWLDLCAALESNRPTMVDDKECDIEFPSKLETEDDETGYRLNFCIQSIKLMRIRKDITRQLPAVQSGQSLLSAISRFERALSNWMNELPQAFQLSTEKSPSFRYDAMLILHVQYHTTWILLHKPLLAKEGQVASPVALLSLNICSKAANTITRLLSTQWVNWCQFIFVLEGVTSSVAIHQLNAISTETNIACLARRNLLLTADMLENSPVMHMDKVRQSVEGIKTFLKAHNLPTGISQVPLVSEDAVNHQSISCVVHPDAFDTQPKKHAAAPMVTQSSNTTGLGTMDDPSVLYNTLMGLTGAMDPLLMFDSTAPETFTQGMFTQGIAPAQFVAANNNNNNNMFPSPVFGEQSTGYPAQNANAFQQTILDPFLGQVDPATAAGFQAPSLQPDYSFLATRKRMREWDGSG
ncbi:fungal-specific transcription factor domain-containing protein [Fennellomyces sp. T-0311]|nr:fungal-specific transcription factor domain-containing protein [Fennellomyces sp. T-0311]